MSDFITLSCPNCGGKLEVSQNTLSLVCQHCGSEHLVRREAGSILLEEYARCPVCNRNDRCEKITKFSRDLPKPQYEVPSRGWYLVPLFVWIPFWGQIPLWVSPIRRKKGILTLLVFIGYLAFFGVGNLLWGGGVEETTSIVIGGLAAIIVFFVFLSIYFGELGSTIADKENMFSTQMKEYENAKEVWGKLYYCHRDDCVYEPLSKKNASLEKLPVLLGISYKPSVDVERGRI